MATASFTSAPYIPDLAAFKAWGQALSNALAAVGFVKTADTGQVDWGTATLPSGGAQGKYEVWRFNDALQATAPIFFRIDYGFSNSGNYPPLVFLAIGTGSNGSGTITNAFNTDSASPRYSGYTPTAYPSYVSSGDGSLLAVSMWPTAVSYTYALHFVIERSRTPSGAPTAEGLLFACSASQNGYTHQGYKYSTRALSPAEPYKYSCAVPSSAGGALAFGGKTPLFPMLEYNGAGVFWQPRSVMGYANADIGIGTSVAVEGFGNYLAVGQQPNILNNYAVAIAWS